MCASSIFPCRRSLRLLQGIAPWKMLHCFWKFTLCVFPEFMPLGTPADVKIYQHYTKVPHVQFRVWQSIAQKSRLRLTIYRCSFAQIHQLFVPYAKVLASRPGLLIFHQATFFRYWKFSGLQERSRKHSRSQLIAGCAANGYGLQLHWLCLAPACKC